MVVAIPAALGHFLTNSLEGAIFAEEIFDNVTIPVRATLEFTAEKVRGLLPVFMIEPADVVNVVVVHDEPTRFLRHLRFGVFHILRHFSNLKKDSPHITGYIAKMGKFFLSHFFLPFLATSAALNSLATLTEIPTFLANCGLWAAAAMVRACFFEVLGIRLVLLRDWRRGRYLRIPPVAR